MNEHNYESIQRKIENILQKDFNYLTNTTKIGAELLRINYFNDKIDKEKQKDNRITILKEPERRVYIQIAGKLRDDQVDHVWNILEKDLKLTKQTKEEKVKPSLEEDIIYQIIELIKLKGYSIEYVDAEEFLKNFQGKYGRLPKKEEISSIVEGYVIMVNEDYLSQQPEASNQSEPLSEKISSILEDDESEVPTESHSDNMIRVENSIGRRKCPSCGDETSIHEVTDKSVVLMHNPRIYGKKKYCGRCGFEWR